MDWNLDVRRPVEEFPIAIQQLIEIAKALSCDARVIVMDEPTSALNAPEVETLFGLIRSLKKRGCGIVYISHKMEEIEHIADRITVLRDGEWVGTANAQGFACAETHRMDGGARNGRAVSTTYPGPGRRTIRLENVNVFPRGLSAKPAVRDVSLSVRRGEILGLGGFKVPAPANCFGDCSAPTVRRFADGFGWMAGNRFSSPRKAIDAGVALLTNDRKATGLVLSLSIIDNARWPVCANLSPGGWRRPVRERSAATTTTEPMRLRAASLDLEVGALSGGNQQKVALAKWLQTGPSCSLLDEPTRGIDVVAKREIYQLMDEWTAQGIAILLITSEMSELLTLSDRIVVLHRGEITARISREECGARKNTRGCDGTDTFRFLHFRGGQFHFRPMSKMTTADKPNTFKQTIASPAGRAFLALVLVLLVGAIFNADGAFFKFGTHRDTLRELRFTAFSPAA